MTGEAKSQLRQRIQDNSQNPGAPGAEKALRGKVAERLRRAECYRKAATILTPPGDEFRQVRLNVLTDRKNLMLPTPNLDKGFLFIDPAAVPFNKRIPGIRNRDNPWSQLIKHGMMPPAPVDLIVSGALAADRDGGVLGDGGGHLDVQAAVLAELGWLAPRVEIIIILGGDTVIDRVPVAEQDARAHWIVAPGGVIRTEWRASGIPPLKWELLDRKRIRRSDLLFALFRRENE